MYTQDDYRKAAESQGLHSPSDATLRRLEQQQLTPEAWAIAVREQLLVSWKQEADLEVFAEQHGYGSAAELIEDQWPR